MIRIIAVHPKTFEKGVALCDMCYTIFLSPKTESTTNAKQLLFIEVEIIVSINDRNCGVQTDRNVRSY